MPKKYRLNDKKIIELCAKKGIKTFTKYFIIKRLPSEEKSFAIVVTKKYDKRAIKRNKIRRQIKSALLKNIEKINNGYYLIIVKNDSGNVYYNDLENDLIL